MVGWALQFAECVDAKSGFQLLQKSFTDMFFSPNQS